MMNTRFNTALLAVLHHEGGFVNHPKDPGGMTNLGVTRRTWENWLGRPVTEDEMRKLNPDDVNTLYLKNYWEPCRCDDMPLSIAFLVFDFAVNAGVRRSSRHLQEIIGAGNDGYIGPNTLAKLDEYLRRNSEGKLIEELCDKRLAYYQNLRTYKYFGRGWTNRVESNRKKAYTIR